MTNVDNSQQLPNVLSICAGYAGIERGLDLAGLEHRVVAYVEIEAYAIASLVAKMEAGLLAPTPIWTDLKTFPVGLFRGAVDIVTGGYPCQPFSAAGLRKGSDDPRHLWPYISEIIGELRPGRVFFENVEGHVSLGLNEVVSDLELHGYTTTWGIFSAVEVGAPHQRKRVYVMANADGQRGRRRNPERKDAGHAGESSRGSRNDAGGMARWDTEPGVGRVVNGCPNRHDRLRLLGNGVVPQTAAKAWLTLNEELTP